MTILFHILFPLPSFAGTSSERDSGGMVRPSSPAEAMYLSENPPTAHYHGHGERRNGRRDGGTGNHSEHRATPVKKIYLNIPDLSDNAEAYVMRPDGTITEGIVNHYEGMWSVTFDTKPMDGSMDGIFNVYVVDKQVVGNTLLIMVAKMHVINHSCGWGHKFKFDKERQRPKHFDTIPLEIVGYELWDKNFHIKTTSGDNLVFLVLHNGSPAEAVTMGIKTQSEWIKTFQTGNDGKASVQLIRDYYPERWSDFNARKRGNLLVTAEYDLDESGTFEGIPYTSVKLVSTFPWRYRPQRREYTSYAYGLGIAALVAVVSGVCIYTRRMRNKRF